MRILTRDQQPMPRRSAMPYKTLLVGTFALVSAASAQYNFADEIGAADRPGVRFFGSAKDNKGSHIPDVTFLLDSKQTSYVFVTDAQGRFRGTLPLDTTVNTVTAKCWKAGLELVRITKRPGPKAAARSAVQVDCLLRRPV